MAHYTTEPMPKDISKERYNLCQKCKNYYMGFCKHCGCLMKLKTKMEDAICPDGKWNKWQGVVIQK